MRELESFSDADFRRTILRAIRLLLVLTLVALPFVWWRLGGWRGSAMLLVGAAISASGLWEWLRLLTAVMARMDAEDPAKPLPARSPVTGQGAELGPGGTPSGAGSAASDGAFGPVPAEVMLEALPRDDAPFEKPWLEELEAGDSRPGKPAKVRGMGMLLTGFFLRLGVVVLVLYVSLKYLEGSVVVLAAGLGLGVFSLTVEGLRLVKAWTV